MNSPESYLPPSAQHKEWIDIEASADRSPSEIEAARALLVSKGVSVGQIREFRVDETGRSDHYRPTHLNGKMVRITKIDKVFGAVTCKFVDQDDPDVKDLRDRLGMESYTARIEDLFNQPLVGALPGIREIDRRLYEAATNEEFARAMRNQHEAFDGTSRTRLTESEAEKVTNAAILLRYQSLLNFITKYPGDVPKELREYGLDKVVELLKENIDKSPFLNPTDSDTLEIVEKAKSLYPWLARWSKE